MKITSYLYILIVLVISSCKGSSCYQYEVSEIFLDSIPSSVLEGKQVDYFNMEDVYRLYSVDSFLIVHREYDKYFYNVYSYDFDSIMSFGLLGRSRNEFLFRPVNMNNQIYTRNGDYIMTVIDNGTCREVNISQTINKGSTVIEGSFQSLPVSIGSSVKIGDKNEQLVYVYATDDDMYSNKLELPKLYYIDKNGKSKEYAVFSKEFKCPNPDQLRFIFYRGYLMKQPEGKRVVMPMSFMNYILCFDTAKRRQSALHINGASTFEDGIPDISSDSTVRCFADNALLLPDKLIVLYYGDYDEMREQDPNYNGRLLVFNWDGILLKSYIMHDFVNEITYNREKKILYGANTLQEKIFTYYFDE